MHGCIEVFRLHSFRHDDSIFIVVTMPCHEGNSNILTKCQFSVFHGWTIRKDVSWLYLFSLPYNRLLIQTCRRVGAVILCQLINGFLTVFIFCDDCLCINVSDCAFCSSNACCTRITSYSIFHTCSDIWRMRIEKRYGLTLHVGTHQSSVSVIVFQERNACGSDRNCLTRRYVCVVNFIC